VMRVYGRDQVEVLVVDHGLAHGQPHAPTSSEHADRDHVPKAKSRRADGRADNRRLNPGC
jgi:hypothetical protein